ncbi:hypothetical protein D0894_04325 [Pseudomonas monteilii]|uniref:Uncharacterized protein n=1 Tax=Pseudomonas monteilii TaxID=76759 RepID=A0A399MF35_9PSED|nr:hypothetical protein D0894_04325 [Pseudomonas monteilii]
MPPLPASCSSGQHFASGFLQIRGHPRHRCLWLTLPLVGCVEAGTGKTPIKKPRHSGRGFRVTGSSISARRSSARPQQSGCPRPSSRSGR